MQNSILQKQNESDIIESSIRKGSTFAESTLRVARMKCPKCKGKLRDDLFCEYCNENISQEDITRSKQELERKLQVIGKRIAIIVPISVVVIIGLSIVYMSISASIEANKQYDAICQLYEQGKYSSALYEMDDFRNFGSPSKKQLSELDKLTDDIEEKLYELNKEEFVLSVCDTYLQYYPNGKYLSQMVEGKAIDNIASAEKKIRYGKFLEAESLLEEVIKDKSTPQQYTEQAQAMLDSIAMQVEKEKGKKEILGTWRKVTGVNYTFEEDGHMSVSLSQYYDSSAGTSMDGREVISIVDEIDRWGKVIRGGTWEFVGYSDDGCPTYVLYYQSSTYVGAIVGKDLIIGLQSGLGGTSTLSK